MRSSTIDILIFIVAGILAIATYTYYLGFVLDDPFISFRYAENFVNGNGLVFNLDNNPVEGYTNFLWVMLVAPAFLLNFDPLIWSKVLGLIISLLQLFFVWKLVIRFTGFSKVSPRIWACLVLLALATNWYVAVWSVGGLETPLFGLLLVISLYLFFDEHYTWSALTLFLATLTRPEGVALAAIMIFVLTIKSFNDRDVKKLITTFLVFALPFILFIAWRYSFYGEFVPNTFYTKTGGSYLSRISAGLGYSGSFFATFLGGYKSAGLVKTTGFNWGLIVVAVFVAVIAKNILASFRERNWSLILAALWVLFFVVYITYVGGDWMTGFRFYVPIIPVILLTLIYNVALFWEHYSPKAINNGVFLVGAMLVIANFSYHQHAAIKEHTQWLRPIWKTKEIVPPKSYYKVAQWIKHNTRESDLIAIEEAGIIPFYAKRNILDLFGLMDKHLARAPGNPPFGKQDNEYVLSKEPDYVVLWTINEGQANYLKWAPHISLIDHKDFLTNYEHIHSIPRSGQRSTFLIFKRSHLTPGNQVSLETVKGNDGAVMLSLSTDGTENLQLRYALNDSSESIIDLDIDGRNKIGLSKGRNMLRVYEEGTNYTKLLRVYMLVN